MTDRILMEETRPTGFRGEDGRPQVSTYRGYYLGVFTDNAYVGGGYEKYKGAWVLLASTQDGQLFAAPLPMVRVVRYDA